jgi:hypothetical protein
LVRAGVGTNVKRTLNLLSDSVRKCQKLAILCFLNIKCRYIMVVNLNRFLTVFNICDRILAK